LSENPFDAKTADAFSEQMLSKRMAWLDQALRSDFIQQLKVKIRTPWYALYKYANDRSAKI
jgi:hypothetical protein